VNKGWDVPAEPESVHDVSEAEFEERVMRASSERPVVVDFWAPWCAPCRMLAPVLAKAIASFCEENEGALALAKVNVDEAPELARRYGISGIPAVKVFRGGRVVAEFVGVRSEADIRQILSGIVPSEADGIATRAKGLADAGELDEAVALYREALAKQKDHAGALLGLAAVAMEKGDHGTARDAASSVDEGSAEHGEAAAILARLDFVEDCAKSGGLDAAEKALAESPGDPDASCALASCLAARGDYARALEHLVRIVERDKGWRDGAAKDAMLRIFNIVGKRSELADKYRSRLARALY